MRARDSFTQFKLSDLAAQIGGRFGGGHYFPLAKGRAHSML